ncbi:MAG: hypothetical protein HAW66_08190 [Shewanella sp.]|nr:hypothetical protein [Shewanella sp.]
MLSTIQNQQVTHQPLPFKAIFNATTSSTKTPLTQSLPEDSKPIKEANWSINDVLYYMGISKPQYQVIKTEIIDNSKFDTKYAKIHAIANKIMKHSLCFDVHCKYFTNSLRSNYDQYFEEEREYLDEFGMSPDLYQTLTTPVQAMNIESDPFIALMEQTKVSQRLIDIEAQVTLHGYQSLFGHEFKITLDNLASVISAELASCPKEFEVSYKTLIEKITLCSQKSPEIPYTEVLTLSVQFVLAQTIASLVFFRPHDTLMSIDTASQIIEDISQLEFNTLVAGIQRVGHQSIEISSNSNSLIKYLESNNKYLMLPSITDFQLPFFSRASRYNIYIAGVSKVKLEFHDARYMNPWFLFCHDFDHADNALIFLKEQKNATQFAADVQRVISAIDLFLENVQTTDNLYIAIWLVAFVFNHEKGYSLATLSKYISLNTYSKVCNELFSDGNAYFFKLPENLTTDDLNAAFFVIFCLFSDNDQSVPKTTK